MKLRICTQCYEHFMGQDCPHCQISSKKTHSGTSMLGIALILGIGLSACGEKEKDSGEDSGAEEPADEPVVEPSDGELYGVPDS